MSHAPPRSYIISARSFDGATRPNAGDIWSPGGLKPNYPLQGKVDQDQIGRFAWSDLLRTGTAAALVLVRCYDPQVGDVVTVRSVAADEVGSGQPEPHATNKLLETHQLTAEWSAPILLGSSDALCVTHAPSAPGLDGTVEFMVFDLSGQVASDFIRARAAKCCDDAPTVAVFNVTNQVNSQLPDPTADLNFYLCTINAGATFPAPSPAVMSHKQQLHVTNLDPTQPIQLQAPVGVTINGVANGANWAVLAGGDGAALRKVNNTTLFGTQVA